MSNLTDLGVEVFAGVVSPDQSIELLRATSDLAPTDLVRCSTFKDRRFFASAIVAAIELPAFCEVADPILHPLGVEVAHTTLRLNVQAPGGKQGWHFDYAEPALAIYPDGWGLLEICPSAETLRQARDAHRNGLEVVQTPVHAGTVAVLHRGAQLAHRGVNGGNTLRHSIVLHPIIEDQTQP